HRPDEEAGHQHNGQRSHPDVVHLVKDVLEIARPASQVRKRAPGHHRIVLNAGECLLERVGQHLAHGNAFHGLGLTTRYLERSVCHNSLSISNATPSYCKTKTKPE